MKLKFFNNSGQTLIEALIALSIIVVIMSGTTVAVISSLNNAGTVKDQSQANKVAQQGMEYIRDQIVNNNMFTTYSTYNNARCMDTNYGMAVQVYTASNPEAYCSDVQFLVDGKFMRTVSFWTSRCAYDPSGVANFTDGIKVTVRTYWKDSKCGNNKYCHNQELISCFINPSKTVVPTSAQGI